MGNETSMGGSCTVWRNAMEDPSCSAGGTASGGVLGSIR